MKALAMRRFGVALVLAIVTSLIVAACGGGDEATPAPTPTAAPRPAVSPSPGQPTPPPPTATQPPAGQATPTPTPALVPPTSTPTPAGRQIKTGGILKQRELQTFDPMDSYNARSAFSILWTQNILSNFLRLNAQKPSVVDPDIAQQWQLSSDGKTYTFSLRQDVKWHDGKQFTAADAAFNFNRARTPPSALISQNAGRMRNVDTITVVDNFTLRMTLKQPSASFLRGIAVPFMLMYPSNVGDVSENWRKTPNGTGPFKLDTPSPTVSAKLTRNDGYYLKDEAGRPLPYLAGQEIYFILDNTTALAAFRVGNLDCGCSTEMFTPQTRDLIRLMPQAKFHILNQDAVHYYFNKVAPFDNINVRKAVHLAVNFDTIRLAARGGFGSYPPTDLVNREAGGAWALPSAEILQMPGYRLAKEPDLAESKRLLEAAGVKPADLPPLRVHISTTFLDFGEVFVTELRRQGWKASLQVVAGGPYTEILARGDFDIAFQQGGRVIDDPVDLTVDYSVTGGSLNWGKWSFPRIDELARAQEAELDPAKRAQLVLDLQRELINNYVRIPALNIGFSKGLQGYVEGYLPPAFSASSNNRVERIWLNK